MSFFDSFRNQFTDFISKCQEMEEKIKRLEDENRKLKSENEKLKSLKDKEEVEKVLEVEDEKCSICIDSFENKLKLPCNHEFCASCICSWAENDRKTRPRPRCPMCRTGFPMSVLNGINTQNTGTNICRCGKKNRSDHHYTNYHNRFLFINDYNRNVVTFLDSEFTRLFEVSLLNLIASNGHILSIVQRLTLNIMPRIGTSSQQNRQKIGEWLNLHIRNNYIIDRDNGEVLNRISV